MAIPTGQIQASLKDYLRIIFQRKWFFFVPFFVVFTTAVVGGFFLPRYYQSAVLVLVEEEEVINPLIPLQGRSAYQQQELTLVEKFKTLSEQILSYPQIIKLITAFNLDDGSGSPLVYEKLIRRIRKRTAIRMKAPDVFSVSYEDRDPFKAKQLANALVAFFIQGNIERKTESALLGVKFAQEQAKIYKERLKAAEEELYKFREKYALELPGEAVDMNTQFLINYQSMLTAIELDLKEANEELDRINKQLSGREPVIISEDLIALNPDVNRLTGEFSRLQAEIDRRMADDPNDPKIPTLISQLEEVKERLRLESKKTIDAETALNAPLFYQRLEQRQEDARKKVEELEARRKQLSALVGEYEGKLETLPEQDKIYSELTRDVRVNQNIYEMLRMKVEEQQLTAVELKEKGMRYEVLEEARLATKPSRPRKLLTAVVAFVIGVLGGFGCVFLAEFADHSFNGVEDAKQHLDIPILGSISKIISEAEIRRGRIRNVKLAWFFVLFLSVLIIFAAMYSYVQEQKIMEKIIRQRVDENTSGIHNLMKHNFVQRGADAPHLKSSKLLTDSDTKTQADEKWMPLLTNKNIYSKFIIEQLRGNSINTISDR